MIEFQRITMKNFLGVGDDPIVIDFQKSKTTLIAGMNGAGKSSTIVDSLTYALFGKPYRNIALTQLPNTINQKNLLVQLDFKVGPNQYTIRRGIKPKVFDIIKNGEVVERAAAERDYQALLETSIIKCNYKTFTQIVILSASTFTPFMQLSTGDRRNIIEDLLDIQIFSAMNVVVKQRLQQVKGDLADITREKASLNNLIATHKQYIRDQQADRSDIIEANKVTIEGYQSQIAAIESTIAAAEEEIQTLSTHPLNIDDLYSASEKLAAMHSRAQGQLEDIHYEIAFFEENDNCPRCHQQIEIGYKDSLVSNLTSSKIKLKETSESVTTKKAHIQERIADTNDKLKRINEHQHRIKLNKVEIRLLEQSITQLEHDNATYLTSQTTSHDKATQEIIDLSEQLEKHSTREAKLQRYYGLLNTAAVLLKDSGIKTAIIKKYIPVVNKLINKYLMEMGFNVIFEINENFEETIKSPYRDTFTYSSFSEGEKARIDLALVFTWREIAQMRNSISTNLLILDEVFDSSLDVDANSSLMNIIYGLQNTHIFVISHKSDGLYDKFERHLIFKKIKNFTKVE